MSKTLNTTIATAAALAALLTAAPMAASAQSNGITSCDAPGGRQQAGAVIGGVLGGILGHQIGGGTGTAVATVAGALGGAFVGDKVEQKRAQKQQAQHVLVRLRNEVTVGITQPPDGGLRVGDEVRIVGSGEDARVVRK